MLGDLPTSNTGRILGEPAKVYHSSGCIGSSALGDFIANKRLFQMTRILKMDALRPKGKHLDFGTGFHSLLLEGDAGFQRDCVVMPHVDGRTKDGKAQKAAAQESAGSRIVIDERDHERMRAMVAAVHENKLASELLFNCADREVTYRPESGLEDVGVQARVDADDLDGEVMVDLKSCDTLEDFERDFRSHGYHRQSAFYRLVRSQVTGEDDEEIRFFFIACEKSAPHRVGVYDVDPREHLQCQGEIVRALGQLRICLDTGVWPRDRNEIVTLCGPRR